MPYFKDAEEVYANLGRLFEDIIADEDLRARFQGADTVFQYRMRRPDSQVTVKALGEEEPQVEFGITKLQPEVVLAMDADTAHRFWLGKVNVTVALARGQISARGPVAKILKLVPLVKPVQTRYESQLEAAGRSDLAQACPRSLEASRRAVVSLPACAPLSPTSSASTRRSSRPRWGPGRASS